MSLEPSVDQAQVTSWRAAEALTMHGVPHAWLLWGDALLRGHHPAHGRHGRGRQVHLAGPREVTLVPGQLCPALFLLGGRDKEPGGARSD